MGRFVRVATATVLVALCAVARGADDEAAEKPPAGDQPSAAEASAAEASAAAAAEAEVPTAETGEPAASDAQGAPAAKDEEPEATVSDEEFLADPFSFLQSDMQSAAVDLKEGQTKPPAEVTQPRILKRFGLLIEELERQGQGAGQAGQRVNRPAEQSSLMRGPGGENEMRAPRDDGRDWADLTPKERQKILQSRTDGFPAGYDAILADYFRRVARAQPAAPADAPAGPEAAAVEPADASAAAGSN